MRNHVLTARTSQDLILYTLFYEKQPSTNIHILDLYATNFTLTLENYAVFQLKLVYI